MNGGFMKKQAIMGLFILLVVVVIACRLSGSSVTLTPPKATRVTEKEDSPVTPTATSMPVNTPSVTIPVPTSTAPGSPTPTPTPSPTRIPEPERIQFEPSASSATVNGRIEDEGYDRYILRAMEGQMMDVIVSSPGDEALLSIWGEDGVNLRYLPQPAWCGRLPSTQDYYIKVLPSRSPSDYTMTVKVSPERLPMPPMVMIEPRTPTRIILPVDPPRLHFLGSDGFPEIIVPAEHVELAKPEINANPRWPFQIAGGRVYYGNHYAEIASLTEGIADIPVPNVLDICNAPMVSPDGERLAWICTDMIDAGVLEDQQLDYHFELVVTDGEGNDPSVVWDHVESGPDYSIPHLVSWQEGESVVYLAWHRLGTEERRFDYHPGMLAVKTDTGEERAIGSLDACDAAVSPDGEWLVQALPGHPGPEIFLQSLQDESMERKITSTEGTQEIGDFSFAPNNTWLVWQEYVAEPSTAEDSAAGMFRLRAVRLSDGSTDLVEVGESFTIYEVGEGDVCIHTTAGWLSEDELIVVRTEERAVGSSYLITLPSEGPGCKISSYDFLGVLDEDLRVADYPFVGFLNVDINYTGSWYRETFGYTRDAKNIKHLVLVAPKSAMSRASAAEIFSSVRFPTEPGWLSMRKDELSWALEYLHLAPEGRFRGQFEPGTYYVAAAFIAAPISKEEAGHGDDVILYPGVTGGGASTNYQEIEIESGENEVQIELTDGDGWACPWLYTYNGQHFERRTEILRNIRGKQNERTEISHIGSVEVIDGSVILRIVEEREEISFIDELYIIVDGTVVHPEIKSQAAAKVMIRDQERLMIADQSYEFAFVLPKTFASQEQVEISVVVSGFYVGDS